jgi:hypothetical protein
MVAGFIATLKVAVTVAFGQALVAPLRGATEIDAGGVKLGLLPGLQHPGLKMSSNNAVNQIV